MLDVPHDGVVIALDPAKVTGYAIGRPHDQVPFLGAVILHREHDDHYDVFGRAVRWINELCEINEPVLIAIEAPVPPSNVWGETSFRTTALSLGLHGIYTGLARARRVKIIEAPISTWRKYFLGHGRLNRDDSKRAAVKLCRMLKWSAPDDNAAEAAGIWAWACAQVAPKAVRRIEPLFAGGPE